MLHGHFHRHAVLFSFTVDDFRIQGRLAPVQVGDKFLDSAFIVKFSVHRFLRPQVVKGNLQSPGEERHLPETLFQNIVIENGLFKNLLVGKEGDHGTRSVRLAVAHHFQLVNSLTSLIPLPVHLTLMVNGNLQPLGQGVYHGSAHSVETAGYLISPAAEFSSGVEYRKYHFHGGNPRLVIDSNRNSPAIIDYGYRIIGVDGHINMVAKSSQRFVHRIVHDFIHQMMKTAGRSAADIHSRPFSHRFQSLQDLDLICSVFCTHSAPLNS